MGPPISPKHFLSKLASVAAASPEKFVNPPTSSDMLLYLEIHESPLMATPAQVERTATYNEAQADYTTSRLAFFASPWENCFISACHQSKDLRREVERGAACVIAHLIETSTPISHKEYKIESSLRQAFELLEPKLRPPFPLSIPNLEEYVQLNRAILYGVLCEPNFAKTHLKHLHAIVTDGYNIFVSLLVNIVREFYARLVDSAKKQLVWVTREMTDVSGVGFDELLVCLLRQIVVNVFLDKWDCLLEEEPLVLTSFLYTCLRLLADHCRLSSNEEPEMLKRWEIHFCVKMLRENFSLCMRVGRDLIRLLLDLVHVPEFEAIWKDLALNPREFRTPQFSDISELYRLRTSSRYSLLRITPEMETQLRFLLTRVKLGSHRRYQEWFAKRFLYAPEREILIVDIVRFICCAHHPSNDIIHSDVLPRWAAMGWLLKFCTKTYVEANVKLAMFYDWLFFNERTDNIMNIEPAMLLMAYSILNYIDVTHSLLEFLFLLVDNFDVNHNDLMRTGVLSAFTQKGVVRSLDVLTSCDSLSPILKERLRRLFSASEAIVHKQFQPVLRPHKSISSLVGQETPIIITTGVSSLSFPYRKKSSLASRQEV